MLLLWRQLVPENQALFKASEGFELMVRMVREKRFTKHCAVKVLDYAVSKNVDNCTALVEAEGLKVLFPSFMGKVRAALCTVCFVVVRRTRVFGVWPVTGSATCGFLCRASVRRRRRWV